MAAPLRTKLELRRPDVLSLPALRSLGDIELHCLAFLQAAEAARLDCRKMHEYIFAGLTANKAVALGVIEPLYCSCFSTFRFFLRLKESEVLCRGLAV